MARRHINQKKLLRLAKVLSDPLRLRILRFLIEEQELSCGEIARRFPVEQPTISHHLNLLCQSGLAHMRKSGRHHFFRADPNALKSFSEEIQSLASHSQAKSKKKTATRRKRNPSKKS